MFSESNNYDRSQQQFEDLLKQSKALSCENHDLKKKYKDYIILFQHSGFVDLKVYILLKNKRGGAQWIILYNP